MIPGGQKILILSWVVALQKSILLNKETHSIFVMLKFHRGGVANWAKIV